MTPLLARFIPEAQELIQQSATGILKLEKDPNNDVVINEVFRAIHTLKGSSGLFDIQPFTNLVHAGEDVLSAVRSGAITLSADITDHILDMLDQVGIWLADMESQEKLPAASAEISHKLASILRAFLPQRANQANQSESVKRAQPESIAWIDLMREAPGFAEFAAAAAASQSPITAVEYRPDEACFYSGEDPVNLAGQIPELAVVAVALRAPWPSIDDLDPYRCNLVFRALTMAARDDVVHLFRYVLDQVSIASLRPDFFAAGTPGTIAKSPKPRAVYESASARMAIRIAQEQLRILMLPGSESEQESRSISVKAALSNVIEALNDPELQRAFTRAIEENTCASISAFIQDWVNRAQGPAVNGDVPPAEKIAVQRDIKSLQSSLMEEFASDSAKANGQSNKPLHKVLKVDQEKLDALMNLIGELVVSKNGLPFLARRAEEVHGSREMAREIKEQYGVIDRLAQEMQGAIMAVRMQPISEAFDRFPRLVRDLARRLSKRIDLVMEGEDTAADKSVIAALGEPLLHIVRNSIDHGVELPHEREEAGKPAQALIKLKAFQESDQIVIEVTDDGRGIDPVKIKISALSKGVITEDLMERLSDQEAINLIFHPGFSTASEISDLSGRGVGMDVVRNNIEKLGGYAAVSSVAGEGTTVRLSLPLSMAVTRVMMVEVGSSLVGIPIDVIVETVRISARQVHSIKKAETFVLRDTIIPLVRMDQLLGVSKCSDKQSDLGIAVLVVRVKGALVGLTVDQFRESIDVILKPFDGLLSGLSGYSGTALLGDGRVLLVLNLKEML